MTYQNLDYAASLLKSSSNPSQWDNLNTADDICGR